MSNITLIACYDTSSIYCDEITYDFYFLRIINIPDQVLAKIKKIRHNLDALMFLVFKDGAIVDAHKTKSIFSANSVEKFNADSAKKYVLKIVMEKPAIFRRIFGYSIICPDYSAFLTKHELSSKDPFEDVFNRMSVKRKEEVVDLLYSEFIKVDIREVDYSNPAWLFYG